MSARAAAPKTVTEYLATIPEAQRADAQRLHKLIRKTAPALKPFVGFGMIGYGPLHVRYATGREVDWFVVGLAGRKNGRRANVTPTRAAGPAAARGSRSRDSHFAASPAARVAVPTREPRL